MVVILVMGVSLMTFVQADAHKQNAQRFVLVTQADQNNEFWNEVIEFTKAVCASIGVGLEVSYGDGEEHIDLDRLQSVINSNPDAIIIPNVRRAAIQFLEMTEEAGIPTFLFNMGLDGNDVTSATRRFNHWVGQITPDDEMAGYSLGKILIERAKEAGAYDSNGEIQMIGVTGPRASVSANHRNNGLNRVVEEFSETTLHQTIPADWSGEIARQRYEGAQRRFPDNQVVWSASDLMALSIIELMENSGRTLNQDAFVGGVDWSREGLEAVADGRLTASVGGHFMEGGWAALVLYDYLNGHQSNEKVILQTEMIPLTSNELADYSDIISSDDWNKVDFTRYSKALNPDLNEYDFDIQSVLDQL